ncbi:3538_t:CDS:2, partial [Scutellospora calospora]
KEFIDVYTCIGCGASGQGYTSLNSGYDNATNQGGKDGKPFNEAYGFIPAGGTIRWITKGGVSRIEWQQAPNQSSGGEMEIPLNDPEVNIPEPGENDPTPDSNLPEPDLFDPTGGEPEIPPIEPDITVDEDIPENDFPDIDPPPVEVETPETDPNDPDQGKDPDTGDNDVPPPDPFDLGDNDND